MLAGWIDTLVSGQLLPVCNAVVTLTSSDSLIGDTRNASHCNAHIHSPKMLDII